MEVDGKIKEDGTEDGDAVIVDEINDNDNDSVKAQVDPSDGFERSKDVEGLKKDDATSSSSTTAAGGFMREEDIAEEGEQQRLDREKIKESSDKQQLDVQNKEDSNKDMSGLPDPTANPSPATPTSNALRTTPKANKNSLNLAISPVPSSSSTFDKALTGDNNNHHRRTRSSPSDERSKNLQLPRSDPPPTPPTRLASSTIKRRSSRSPNNASINANSSSPFSSSNALQNAVASTSSSTSLSPSAAAPSAAAAASTSKIDSSPPSISSSSMKRSPSSPLGSPTLNNNASSSTSSSLSSSSTSTDVFGSSSVIASKRRKSSSPPRSSSSPSRSPSSSATGAGASSPTLGTLHVTNTASQGSPTTARGNSPKASTSASISTSSSSSSPPLGSESGSPSKGSEPSSPTVVYSALAPPGELGPNHPSVGGRSATPRRVKVYALHESNWIDLGTGSCTYYRGVSQYRNRYPLSTSGNRLKQIPGQPPPSPPARMKELNMAGRELRDALHHANHSEETIDIVDLDDEIPLADDEDHAGWIEVVKEGRWKSDIKPARARQRPEGEVDKDERKEGGDGEVTKTASSSPSKESDSVESDDDDYDRIWTTRIEKPEVTGPGYDREAFMPVPGGEDGEEIIGRYRRQQDTLIVWKSASSDTELALSFAATAGCLEVWQFLENLHTLWDSHMDNYMMECGEEELEESQDMHGIAVPHEIPANGLGLGLGRFSQQIGLLEEPTISNLAELERGIKAIGRTPLGREKLSTYIGRTVSIMMEAE